jgi:putrescine transport system substrate-binding protein
MKPMSLICALTLALAAPWAAAQEEEKVLNIYNWSDYIAEDTIRNFEKETGIRVRYDNFDNNEIVHAKLVAGKTGYDIVMPSSNWAKLQIDGGLLRKLDKSQLPNLKHMDPAVLSQLARMDPGNEYMVNWLWGYTTVGINVDKVKAALGSMPMPDNVWDLVFKPEYISKLKSCGVSFLDSATEVVPAALHYLGKPSFSKSPSDHAAAAQLLKSVRPHVTLFSSSGYINDMASGSICVALGWSGDIGQARQRGRNQALTQRILQLHEAVEDLVGQATQYRVVLKRMRVGRAKAGPIRQCFRERGAVTIGLPERRCEPGLTLLGRHVRTSSMACPRASTMTSRSSTTPTGETRMSIRRSPISR